MWGRGFLVALWGAWLFWAIPERLSVWWPETFPTQQEREDALLWAILLSPEHDEGRILLSGWLCRGALIRHADPRFPDEVRRLEAAERGGGL